MDKELPVSVWPEWKIVEKIGEGSFGKVYKAQRTERGRSFYSAIKIITIPSSRSELNSVRSETSDEKSTREYFQNVVEDCIQEVSTMEYFRGNSHIVSVEDFKVMEYLDEIGWDIFIRMEYLTNFMDYCTGKELTEKEVVKLGCDLSKAMDYCRQLNIIHRDIKPENIFVSRFGDFKLGDFGIARELERTMSGMSKKGTFSYMAPEMYRGELYDSQVDIYSLGIVLYKLMNHNRLPFLNLEKQLITYRDKENALARRMSGEKLPKPADASDEFSRIILKACAYSTEERYREPEEFYRDLDDLRNHRLQRLTPAAGGIAEKTGAAADKFVSGKAQNMAVSVQSSTAYRKTQTSANAGNQAQRKPRPNSAASSAAVSQTQSKPYRSAPVKKSAVPVIREVQETPEAQETLEVRTPVRTVEKKKPKKRQKKQRQKKQAPNPWTIAVAVVSLAACIITGVYVKLILDENARAQNRESVVHVLEDNDKSTAQIDDFSTAIQTIMDQATVIVNQLEDCKEEGKEGKRLRYYNKEGTLVKSLVYPSQSEDEVYEEYYYWNEKLFFAYIWIGDKNELYYYNDQGKMIRWIDQNGAVHDGENDNEEYVKRAEKYWKNSLEQFQIKE